MSKEKKYYVSRNVTQTDRTHYGPFTFAAAMHCMEEWRHTGDALALTDADYRIIPEYDWPADELNAYARHAMIELEAGRQKAANQRAKAEGGVK